MPLPKLQLRTSIRAMVDFMATASSSILALHRLLNNRYASKNVWGKTYAGRRQGVFKTKSQDLTSFEIAMFGT